MSPNPLRSAAQRVNLLVGRHGRSPDDPIVVAARQVHAEESIAAAVRRAMVGLPSLPPDARARLVRALDGGGAA